MRWRLDLVSAGIDRYNPRLDQPKEDRVQIACLDFEGVLVPEMWIAVADRFGIDELRVTTRDIPDYGELMKVRLEVMNAHGLTLHDVHASVAGLEPFEGAAAFIDTLRSHYQVAIISDTFYEFAGHLLDQLGRPMLLCHRLDVDAGGRILGIRLRQPDPKLHAVRAFQSLKYRVVAAGDSYNDTTMLKAADAGILYRPSQKVLDDFPELPVAQNYFELKAFFARSAT